LVTVKMPKTPISWTLAALVAGCAAKTGTPALESSVAAAPVRPPLVSLQRDRCIGWCPAYRVDIDVDGAVRYEGRGNVCRDEASDRLTPWKLEALREAITRSNFANLREHCCDCPVNDNATTTITVSDPPPAKTVVDAAYPCPGAPLSISKLADEIDEIVDIERWIGTDEERRTRCF
jgi:hypothetical protein